MLNKEEILLLQKALDALEEKESCNEGIGESISSIVPMILSNNKETEEKLRAKFKELAENHLAANQQIKERITLLKAKLIHMKDKVGVEDIIGE